MRVLVSKWCKKSVQGRKPYAAGVESCATCAVDCHHSAGLWLFYSFIIDSCSGRFYGLKALNYPEIKAEKLAYNGQVQVKHG
jgi:hypothetical protein